jgi:serine O-acetyltransferase
MRHDHPLRLLRADLRASLNADGARPGRAEVVMRMLLTTRLQAVILLRLAQWAHRRLPPLAAVLKYINVVVTGADIAPEARFGPGLKLFHPSGVVVGPRCIAGADCTLMQQASLGENEGGSPRLGDRVFIGAGARLFGGVELGDDCIVGANAVVVSSFPADTFIGGVPAKIIRA